MKELDFSRSWKFIYDNGYFAMLAAATFPEDDDKTLIDALSRYYHSHDEPLEKIQLVCIGLMEQNYQDTILIDSIPIPKKITVEVNHWGVYEDDRHYKVLEPPVKVETTHRVVCLLSSSERQEGEPDTYTLDLLKFKSMDNIPFDYVGYSKVVWRCPYCGRDKFQKRFQPHKCVGGFRKNFKKSPFNKE